MPQAVSFLNSGVVAVFVADEVRGFDVAAVGVLPIPVEHFLVELNVVVVDGVIEGDGNHLRDILGWQIAGNGSSIFGAEAVRKNTDGWITGWRSVGIVLNV